MPDILANMVHEAVRAVCSDKIPCSQVRANTVVVVLFEV